MSGYDLYVFILCFIVFTELTLLFGFMLHYIIKQALKAIAHGLEDERIKTEYSKQISIPTWKKKAARIVSVVLVALVLSLFATSIGIHLMDNLVPGQLAVPKVVLSSSMAYAHEDNTYLQENGLNNQIATFDLIFTHKLPDEYDLELYDIVVYEYRGELIVHRIVGIEEPNASHPDCRHFLLQGDAVKYTDEFPVLYSQMRAIYRNAKIPFVGSFFTFMQSPAGYLCILLVIFAVVATPIAEKKLWNAKLERLIQIGVITPDDAAAAAKGR